jgi:hypothetical protein
LLTRNLSVRDINGFSSGAVDVLSLLRLHRHKSRFIFGGRICGSETLGFRVARIDVAIGPSRIAAPSDEIDRRKHGIRIDHLEAFEALADFGNKARHLFGIGASILVGYEPPERLPRVRTFTNMDDCEDLWIQLRLKMEM